MSLNWQSLRQTVRSLRRNPGFSLTVIVCLALGLTANTSVLTMLNAVVLRPLPYPQSDELVYIGYGNGTVANLPVPGAEYRSWMQSNSSIVTSAMFGVLRGTIGGDHGADDVLGGAATSGLAQVLGIKPLLGRFLNADDERLGAAGSVVLSYGLWSRMFGGDSSVVGRSIHLSGLTVTVAGVMPFGFDFPHGSQFWRAMPLPTDSPQDFFTLVARRRPDVSVDDVQRDLSRIPRAFTGVLPFGLVGARPTVVTLRDFLFGSAKPAMLMLFAAATLLLVVGGAGVANLVLARNTSRSAEFALRLALGATFTAVVTPIVVECLLLAFSAAVLGVMLSVWVSRMFVHIGPPILEKVGRIDLDWRVLLITLLWTIVTAMLVGIGAALHVTRRGAFQSNALKGRVARTGRWFNAARRGLVIAQIAIATLLMTGAGLLTTSLERVSNLPLGFQPSHVVIATIYLPRSRYENSERVRAFYNALRNDLTTLPGVEHVTYGTPPMTGFGMMLLSPPDAGGHTYQIASDAIGPDYFLTYQIPIRSGRAIRGDDNESSEPVVVINQSAKDLVFPDRSPLGEMVSAITIRGRHPRVVGVSADVPMYEVGMRPQAAAYGSLAQTDERPTELSIRTRGDETTIVRSVRRLLAQRDAQLAASFSLPQEAVRRSVAPRVFTATLASGFAALALTIATIGLFGLLSYLATQRAHEMAIRVALGARRNDVVSLMLREGVWLVGTGVVVGSVLTLALNGLLASLIFDVGAHDPTILIGAAALVGGVAVAATLLPALRSSRADPMRALRQD